ncbi:serine/arginine-rich splicing factor SC35-like isoform X2 [Oryza glaberrima]|uniref:serine/arginine-rich splicing factor SC35-like isoform X2 n=1 Tax=Oryza glaberrima TaxID=4538 RepID=UPI00224C3E21|nr:serine/arginine-rich splicing factor SC35-like isoform X2 [Oryza glaberrima]
MSRLGRYGPPAVRDSYSLLVLNVSFRTTADDLLALFDRCGEVLDIRIPRDRRTGDSRGFAFVRYKYEDEAQKAVDKLDGESKEKYIYFVLGLVYRDNSHTSVFHREIFLFFISGTGRTVDGRDIMVQFAKYGPNAERIHKGRIVEEISKPRGRSRSPSPKRRYRADYRDRGYRDDYRDRHYRDDYQDREYRRSRSIERYERERYQEKGYRRRSRSISPDYDRRHRKNGPRDERSPRSRSPST